LLYNAFKTLLMDKSQKKLNKLLDRLKEIKISRRVKKIAVILIVVILVIIGFSYAVNISKPGDLLFTIKGFAEDRELTFYKGKEADFYVGKLKDRVEAFQSLANNNQCVQLLLAQDELVLTVKTIQTNNYYQNKVNDIAQLLSKLDNLKTNCSISDAIQHLSNIYNYMQFNYSTADNQKAKLEQESVDLQKQYNDASDKLKNSSFSSQDKINKTTSLLLVVKRSLETYTKNKADPKTNFDNELTFNAARMALDAFNTAFTGDINQVIGFKSDVQAVCLIYTDKPECSKENINGKWNSIYEKTDLGSQVQLGQTVLKSYLVFVLPDAKFN